MPGQPLRLTDLDNGRTISVAAGATFSVTLEANPTTGYMWAVTAIDEAVIKYTANRYVGDPAPPDITGSGGREIWEFQAVGSGTTTLEMEYRRHWEPDQPDGAFSITLNIE